MTQDSTELIYYSSLVRRFQAALIDSLVVVLLFVITLTVIANANIEVGWLKLIMLVSPILLTEPLLLTFYGGTIGYFFLNQRVLKRKSGRKLNFLEAFSRYIFKLVLGVISLIFMFLTRKHQALHDLVVDSIVIVKDPAREQGQYLKAERSVDESIVMPSNIRRLIVISGYNVVIFLILAWFHSRLISDECYFLNKCSSFDKTAESWIGFIWISLLALSIILGWKGMLYGCRKKTIDGRITN